jgi:MinD-like ATPase involved in chromosome partitioning or flagellar assembly
MSSEGPRGPGARRVAVLVAAAGASWETEALDRLARGAGIVIGRRCVDLTDLLATASAGTASVAVVSAVLPGLDADSIFALRRSGLRLVVVAAPADLLDGDTERLRRLGGDHLLAGSELGGLAETVLGAAAAQGADRGSTVDEPSDRLDPAGLPETRAAGRLVAVWGPTGAPGRTTVAVGVAAAAAEAGHEVLLLDVDTYGGAVAQHLGVLDEASGLLAAVRSANAGQLDADRLAALTRRVGDRLRVLTGLPRPDRWPEVRPRAFADLLHEAARAAAFTVLDLGFSLEAEPADPFGSSAPQRNEMTLTSLQRADEVLVVGAADPVGLARLARGLVDLHDLLPALRPRVVVNRARTSLGWTDREIRGMVEGFVTPLDVHFLPDDRSAADRALMAGRSLTETGDSALGAAMSALARDLVGDPAPASARRAWVRRRRAGRDR